MEKGYVIKNYGKKSVFSSFLPGIAGEKGIPIWCCYVNRGQGVASFGIRDKDHSIMEFYPAHTAYQNVKRTGFRTFLRCGGNFCEPFADESRPHEMKIFMNKMQIMEENEQKLRTEAMYYVLPEEKTGALVRKVSFTNLSDKEMHLEILDGMPALVPYGIELSVLKNMTETGKAWMQAETAAKGIPFFRVRASLKDSASVGIVEGGNFAFCMESDGTNNVRRLPVCVDPKAVFLYDLSFEKPVAFMEGGLEGVRKNPEVTENRFPCCFFQAEKKLQPGETCTLHEIFGQTESLANLKEFQKNEFNREYFAGKERRADTLVQELTDCISTETASENFDAYCRYTYMDNGLRGGFPIRLGSQQIFYLYSRKHGDLERDYNSFSLLPEFYSQGSGNFRDVAQNRRSDSFFSPFVRRENIKKFFSLVQPDGYNPLLVGKSEYVVSEASAEAVLQNHPDIDKEEICKFVKVPFTPGRLYEFLNQQKEGSGEKLFRSLADHFENAESSEFGEGYWCDHFSYCLDLIHDYLEIFPEEEKNMLYEKEYTYFLPQVKLLPRRKRYQVTEKGLRQYHFLDEENRRTAGKILRKKDGSEEIIKVTLAEKILVLCSTKITALDAYGMGIEMEGGKPGWYDALNGLPGIFGSSVADACELERLLDYLIRVFEKYPCRFELSEEVAGFIREISKIIDENKKEIREDSELLHYWNEINDAKEAWREETFSGFSGKTISADSVETAAVLSAWQEVVRCGIRKAICFSDGILPTYFSYEVTEYTSASDGIVPLHFEVRTLPHFLEGTVRYLKLDRPENEKKAILRAVRASDLFDRELGMYKVNASLKSMSYEAGRCRAFASGWLENESIWLHMEYKYLLELLRSGFYREFFEDFRKAAIPFLDSGMYGRSILENSSFLASSANSDKSVHGKGFVARLSGSAAEFLSMWKLLMFGPAVFKEENSELSFAPRPALPAYLIPERRLVRAQLLGKTEVIYRFQEIKDYIPGQYRITEISLTFKNGESAVFSSDHLTGAEAEKIRDGEVEIIQIRIS